MKLKAFVILAIIIVSLFPVYIINKYLQRKIRPRESLSRLFTYMLAGFTLVFIYTFLVVLLVKSIFPDA